MQDELQQTPLQASLIPQAKAAIESQDMVTAEALCLQILDQDPQQSDALFLLGIISCRLGATELAVDLFEQAIEGNPTETVFHFNLALAYQSLKKQDEAEKSLRRVLALNPNFAPAYYQLGMILYNNSHIDEASEVFHKAVRLGLDDSSTLFNYAITLREQNRTQEAIDLFTTVHQRDPQHLGALLHSLLTLPVLYETEAEIPYWRDRYAQGLKILKTSFDASELGPRIKQKAISRFAPYYLNYQCQNDRDLQVQYGTLVQEITKQLYAQNPHPVPKLSDRIRIGFVSACFFYHSVGRSCLSWVEGLDGDRFEIFCYHIGQRSDEMTQRYRGISDHFYHFPEQIDPLSRQVIADDLHILIFLDIGMSPLMTQLGSLRLCAIQCVRWGHPITTGLSTIDYYLSSEVMEPANGQEHYCEKLVLLPGLGKALLTPPEPQDQQQLRARFDLDPHCILYLASQSLLKYLPQYDKIYAQILTQMPGARIIFMERVDSQRVVDQFIRRMGQTFEAYSLDWSEVCVLIPKLGYQDYIKLNLCCDIFLDSFGWSGDNTTLDAVACGLPVITCPGEFMRGRHAAGILKYLGVTETIAETPQDYIQCAVRLGRDPQLRQRISKQIKDRHQELLNDRRHVRFLEQFYQQIINQSG